MSNVPAHLPGDLGEHDPRREAHPIGNEPGSGGHEVKLGSNEAKGIEHGATAAEHSDNNNPRSDNTAEHAFNGGSVENMDRQKRQQASDIPGGRTGHDGVEDHLTRAGVQQESNRGDNYGSGLTGNTGSGLTGSGHHHDHSHTHHHGSTGSGLTGGLSQSGTEPISGVRGAGVGGAPYDGGNLQSTGFSGSDPQERHQLHHGTAHHAHDFSHQHNTRTGELLDPASGRDTGIPGYAGGASGLTGSHTGTGLTGSSHTGTGLTGSHTGTGLTGSNTTGYGQTGTTGERLREDVREGERGLTGSHTGTGLTGSHTGTGLAGSSTGSGLTGSHTGTGLTGSNTTGYGQTGTTGDRLREDVREGERGLTGTSTGHHGSTGSGLTGSHTGQHETTGERVRDEVREGEHAHNSTGTTEHKKPSLLDKLNPLKDSDGDGKKGFMK
ncbi:unnamed protein product [Aureobasidium uvarum]|uniref:Uncharacterized protein n=1 Tax=Aureobasidium uvarum TaxID=2773716 RepID=A0A9N8KHF7_9PEZI|nr:unnamed protein product [Aureobasidium uvarum]